MDGPSLGNSIGSAILTAIVIGSIVGAVGIVGGFFLLRWLLSHVSVILS